MYRFFEENMFLLYFVYGLVFFIAGFAIIMQRAGWSELRLAKNLKALALFALLHGLSEWGVIFIPIQSGYLGPRAVFFLQVLHKLLVAVSFTYLLWFGLDLSSDSHPRWRRLAPTIRLLPWVWLVSFIIYPWLTSPRSLSWLMASEIWSRYLLAFPGSLISAYALYKQKEDVKAVDESKEKFLVLSAVSLVIYGLVAGLVVPPAGFFPASVINTHSFFLAFNLPIPVFRTLAGLGFSYFSIRAISVFKMEEDRRMAQTQRMETILKERERIARDLHDGVIQGIYAVGLQMENCRYLVNEDPQQASRELSAGIRRLNDIISDLRHYIVGLKKDDDRIDFVPDVLRLISDFRRASGLEVELNVRRENKWEFGGEHARQVYYILQELLLNVAKHARASRVEISFLYREEDFELTVKDDGVGFEVFSAGQPGGEGNGLKNIFGRVRSLGGSMNIESQGGRGTKVRIRLPYA